MAETGKIIGLINALGGADPAVIEGAVESWLDEHPEATTTIEDGAVTKAKLDSELQQAVDDVNEIRGQIDHIGDDLTGEVARVRESLADAVPLGYTAHPGLYIATNNSKLTATTTAAIQDCLVSFPVKPWTTYVIRKGTSTVMRAAAGMSDALAAGDRVWNLAYHQTASDGALEVYTNRCEHLYVQLWASSDAAALQDVDAHLNTLTVTPKVSAAQETADSAKAAAGLIAGDVAGAGATVVEGLFINTTTGKIAAPTYAYSYNNSEHRLVSVPITGGRTYRVQLDVARHLRAATGAAQAPTAGQALANVVSLDEAGYTLDVQTGEDDAYLYIQLFTDDDPVIYAPQYYLPRLMVYVLPEEAELPRLPYGGAPIVEINHRGFNSVAPENTLPAFRLSKVEGYTWIELDVQMTSDGVPVVIHDATINRTARNPDGTEVEGSVAVDEVTYEQLLGYDFGIWKGQEYAGTRIPTLSEALDFARQADMMVAIELKSATVNTAAAFDAIQAVVKAHAMEAYVEYFSSTLATARIAANAVENGVVGLAVSTVPGENTLANLSTLRRNGNAVRLHTDPTDDETALGDLDAIAAAGYEIVFRGHTEAQVLLAPKYAHMFISNAIHPAKILREAALERPLPGVSELRDEVAAMGTLVGALEDAVDGKYTLPEGGIPSGDLAIDAMEAVERVPFIGWPDEEISRTANNRKVSMLGNAIRQTAFGVANSTYQYLVLCKGRISVAANAAGMLDDLAVEDLFELPTPRPAGSPSTGRTPCPRAARLPTGSTGSTAGTARRSPSA